MSFSITQSVDDQHAKPFEATFEQVDDLLQHATCTTEDILQVVQLVIISMLPRIVLAVKEEESTLAASLLGVVQDNATKIQAHAGDMQQRHMELQQHAPLFSLGSHDNEPDSACQLAKRETSAHMKRQPDSPRSVASTEYASDDGDQSSDDEYQLLGLECTCEPLLCTAPRAMRTVDEIARVDMASWQNLDEAIQNLVRMKQHASCLVQCCSKSEKIRARAEQRLIEYANSWASLETSCKQHVAEREKSVMLMREIYSH